MRCKYKILVDKLNNYFQSAVRKACNAQSKLLRLASLHDVLFF